MRHLSHVLTFTLLTALLLAIHVDAVDPLHDFAWCTANMVCNDPNFPVMGMYFVATESLGYSCLCSVSEGTCGGVSGESYCAYADANVNCDLSFGGEMQAINAGYQYGMCRRCNTGCQLSDYPNPSFDCWACSATVPNCAYCSSEGVCDKCDSLHTLPSDGKACYACNITGCPSCTADNVCETCSSGYTISSDKTSCFSCGITGCNGCTADGVCGSCQTGYTLSADKSMCHTCGIPNCNGCTADCVCDTCGDGYSLSDDKTVCYACNIANCNKCSADGMCDSCAAGYSLSDLKSTCFSCNIANCTRCSAHGVCDSCVNGYKLKGTSKCKKNGIGWWVWLIVGIAAAAVVAGVIVLVVCCLRRRRCRRPRGRCEAEESSSSIVSYSNCAVRRDYLNATELNQGVSAADRSTPTAAYRWTLNEGDYAVLPSGKGSSVYVANPMNVDSQHPRQSETIANMHTDM